MTSIPPMPPVTTEAVEPTERDDGMTPRTRRAGVKTMAEGLGFTAAGVAGLWISFWLGDSAKTILGAGPLIGGGMIGYGGVQFLLGSAFRPVRWIAAVIAGIVTVGATIVLLETTLGVTFA